MKGSDTKSDTVQLICSFPLCEYRETDLLTSDILVSTGISPYYMSKVKDSSMPSKAGIRQGLLFGHRS